MMRGVGMRSDKTTGTAVDIGFHATTVEVMAIEKSFEGDKLLPWWRNPLNIILIALVVLLGTIALGYRLGERTTVTAHNTVDSGFLQDMRIHHEQAVAMSSIYLNVAPNGNTTLRTIAREIMLDQTLESGRMVQMLRFFSESETNESDNVMGWMGTPVPLADMPGYATDNQMKQLSQLKDAAADTFYITLMIAHHKGALHMAEYAVKHGINSEVKAFCESILTAQQGEINELQKIKVS
jgi:uncharacterized protein (DUF305 family)